MQEGQLVPICKMTGGTAVETEERSIEGPLVLYGIEVKSKLYLGWLNEITWFSMAPEFSRLVLRIDQ